MNKLKKKPTKETGVAAAGGNDSKHRVNDPLQINFPFFQ